MKLYSSTLSRVLLSVAPWLLLGCAVKIVPEPPLRIAADEFRQRVTTVCVAPTRSELRFPDSEKKLAQFTDLLVEVLNHHGLKAVGADQTIAVTKAAVARGGGYFDVHTGQLDEARYAMIRRDTFASLKSELGCDAVLTPTIAFGRSDFVNGKAEWDGISESVGGGQGAYGWVRVLSLWVSVRDADDKELYFGTSGLQTLAHVESGFFHDTMKSVAADALLTDQVRNERSIFNSVEPIIAAANGRPSSPPP